MDINTLLSSSDTLIASTAKMAVSYKEALDQKLLTPDQFKELMADLVDLKRIDEYAMDIERQVLVQKAFTYLQQFATLALKL